MGYLLKCYGYDHDLSHFALNPPVYIDMDTPARTHGIGTPGPYSSKAYEDYDLRGSQRLAC
jgi:hypothetical protein